MHIEFNNCENTCYIYKCTYEENLSKNIGSINLYKAGNLIIHQNIFKNNNA